MGTISKKYLFFSVTIHILLAVMSCMPILKQSASKQDISTFVLSSQVKGQYVSCLKSDEFPFPFEPSQDIIITFNDQGNANYISSSNFCVTLDFVCRINEKHIYKIDAPRIIQYNKKYITYIADNNKLYRNIDESNAVTRHIEDAKNIEIDILNSLTSVMFFSKI